MSMLIPLSSSTVPSVSMPGASENVTTPCTTFKWELYNFSDHIKDFLQKRFSDNLHDLGTILQICEPLEGFKHVDNERLGKILCDVSAFDCGKKQLVAFAKSCKANDLKLSFVTPLVQGPDSDCYALKSSNLLKKDRVIYLSVNQEVPISKERYIGTLNLSTFKIGIENMQLNEIMSRIKTLEGYKVGHELSHATAWVKHFENMRKVWKAFILENLDTIRKFYDAVKKGDEQIKVLKIGNRDLTFEFWKDMFKKFGGSLNLDASELDHMIQNMAENIPENQTLSQWLSDTWQYKKDEPLKNINENIAKLLFTNFAGSPQSTWT